MSINYLNEPIELSKSETKLRKDEYDFSFILTDEHLKGVLSNICNTLKHPVTIININVSDTKRNRVDSDSIFFSLRTSCDTLRRCASSKLCLECDYHHASLFKGLRYDNIIEGLNENIAKMKLFKYRTTQYKKPIIHFSKKRPFISYNCPMSGFCELVFPVFFEGKVIATMFVGQINIKSKTHHKKVATEFIESHKDLFNEYLKIDKNCTLDKIARKIKDGSFRQYSKNNFININHEPIGIINDVRKNVITTDEFNELVEKIGKELDGLETLLIEHMENKRKAYFSKLIKKCENDFFNKINPNDFSSDSTMQVWTYFKEYCLKLKNEFEFSDILCFSDDLLLKKDQNLIFSLSASTKHTEYNFNNIEQYIDKNKFLPTSTFENKNLFYGLFPSQANDTSNLFIIAFSKMAILFELTDLIDKKIEIKNLLFKEIISSIAQLYSFIQGQHLGYYKAKYQMTLRLYRHECQHVSKGLSNKTKNYFEEKKPIYLNAKKREDIYNDLNSSISLLNGMASSIGLLVGTINKDNIRIKKSDVSIFKEILYKWTDMFDLILSENNTRIVVPNVSKFDDNRPFDIYTNKELLEQVVYNIVDNAIKYSIWGSKIHLDFSRVFSGSSIATLSVSNYTTYDIAEGDKPYKLYYRGVDTNGNIEGEGIGLYVAKQISNILDIEIYHKKYKISNYNIPIAYEYVNRNFDFNVKDESLTKKLIHEMDRLKNKNGPWDFNSIVNFDRTKPISDIDIAEETLINEVCKPTYMVEFCVDMKIK